MRVLHCTRAVSLSLALMLCALGLASSAGAQTGVARFTIVLRGTAIGTEDVTVERTATGTTISSSGRIGPPLDIVLRTLQVRYGDGDAPQALTLDASAGDVATSIQTAVAGTTATTTSTPAGGEPVADTDTIDAAAVLLPNQPFVAPYEALAMRLRTAAPGVEIPMYQPRGGSFRAQVGMSIPQQIQTLNGIVRARQTLVTFTGAGAQPLAIEIWGDDTGRLLRVKVPAQQLDFMREDIASVSARLVTVSRPNDEDVRIPANGFSLAGTLSKPAAPAAGPLPAVILISGANRTDRDEIIAGIPIFGQIADALADSGTLVLRYDKRGIGQSGGRSDAATLTDFAEDARAAVTYLRDRKDVDRRRIALVGHSEGGWVAMLAAAGNGRVAAVGLLSTAGISGAELNLFQAERGMVRAGRPDAEREATLSLQRHIQEAVITGRGWDDSRISSQQRRQADTPYFQSFLTLDPSKLVRRLAQPLLILQGELDRQLPPDSATALDTLARERKKDPGVAVVRIPAVNHLLVPAATGEADEYATLPDRKVSAAVTSAIAEWLNTAAVKK